MISSVNVELLLVNNQLCIPIESLNRLLNLKKVEDKIEVEKSTTIYTAQEIVNEKSNLQPKVELDFSLIKPLKSNEPTRNNLGKTACNKTKLLNSSINIVAANSMLKNLLEDSKTLNWYKTNTYWGIARKLDNTLICSYTPEPRRSKFLSVYIPMRILAGHLVLSTNRKYKLILNSVEYPIARITTTNICIIHTHSSKSFYTLIKTLIKMFEEV